MTMLRATHLATVKSAVYDLRWEEFNVKRPARIVAVRPCLTGVSMRSAEIIDISQGGATFIVSTTAG
ncbi:PilZ domain-containing protein, partial [Rhizobium johnstonii]